MFPIKITMPFPPTVNTYYRVHKGRVLMSEKGRQFRTVAMKCCAWQKAPAIAIGTRLSVILNLYPSDKRHWDIDNRAKAVLDALQHAGVIPDDEQVDRLTINRCPVSKDDDRVDIVIFQAGPTVETSS